MREKTIENKLRAATRGVGGIAIKFVSPGMSGVPDRLILLPGKHLAFVEVKAPGMQLRPLVLHKHFNLCGGKSYTWSIYETCWGWYNSRQPIPFAKW